MLADVFRRARAARKAWAAMGSTGRLSTLGPPSLVSASWACAGPAGGALLPVAPERPGRAHAVIPGSLLADFCFCGRTQGLQAALGRPVALESRGGRLLQALGWEAGAGLGRRAQGRTEPVPLHLGQGRRGLGS